LDENIPYLEGGGRGVPRALKKKIYPIWFLKSQRPLQQSSVIMGYGASTGLAQGGEDVSYFVLGF